MAAKKHVLVVGAGSIGERHVRCFLDTGRASVSVCEPEQRTLRRIAGSHALSGTFSDVDTALESHEKLHRFDAAVIATPAHLHVPLALQLAAHDIDLLVEKPLGTTLDGVDELEAAVRSRGLVAAVAYVYRASPALQAMKRSLDEQRFGEPLELVAVSGQHFPTYRPAYREIYYRDRDRGGGAVQDAMTHFINAGEWLVGPVDRLVADAAHQQLEGVDVEDTVHVLARQGGVLGNYSLNQHQAPNESTLTVICDGGTVRFELPAHRWRWMARPGDSWTEESEVTVDRDRLFVRQAASFLDAVEGKAPPLCSLDAGLQTLRANLAILRSVEQSLWMEVGP